MAKADVLSLVNRLSTGLRDSTAADNYYDRIVFEHGLARTSLVNAAYVAGVADTLSYTLPPTAIRVLGIFYDDVWLYEEDQRGLEMFDPHWRSLPGEPRTYTYDMEDQNTVDLVPVPRRAGATIGGDTPFTAFPRDNLTFVFTANLADVQPWEELFTSCDILAREFARDSDHQDQAVAKAWRGLADVLTVVIDNAQSTP
jgi:hypothetical protein